LHEYLAGTNPLDSQDYLQLAATVSQSNCALSFNTRTGRTYAVEAAANPGATNAWSLVAGGINGSGLPATVNDALTTADTRFYRLKVTLN
jgi:hypothetical protein